MSRQIRCPNCGAEHALINPGITMLICHYCKSVVYWDAETVLKAGVQSILPEADTRLFMHATGKLRGQSFEVVGHLRYSHGRGTWDEWYLQMGDGRVAWLSEDERELSLEEAVRADAALPEAQALRVGQLIALEGINYTVREKGSATCLGGEGQLPFTILPEERYPYADLASPDGAHFATIEYENQQGPTACAYAGQVLSHEELSFDSSPPQPTATHAGKGIKCANCAAPLELDSRREIKTLVCSYCGAQMQLTGAEAKVMGTNPRNYQAGFVFEIGQKATLLGQSYEVCGRLLYKDDEGYLSKEYLLFTPGAGYLWLAEENGHYVLFRPTQQAPAKDPFRLSVKHSITIGPSSFRFYESGSISLIYVDGALPWLAASGDRTRYADLIAPPRMVSVERDADEIEYFQGQYFTPQQIRAAFHLKEHLPRPTGVHPAQPFVRRSTAKALMIIGFLFALVNLILLLGSVAQEGRPIFTQKFTSQDYQAETMSRPFTVGPHDGTIMAMAMQAPLNNSWLAFEVGLVDDQDRVVEEMEGDIAYYHGVEDGESWSEGSRSNTRYFKAPPAGTYRLILKGNCGSGETGPCRGELLTITLSQGATLSRYFLMVFIFSALFPFYETMRKYVFEARRWAPVTESDDDDD